MIVNQLWIALGISIFFSHLGNFSKLLLVCTTEFFHQITFDVFQMLVKPDRMSQPTPY